MSARHQHWLTVDELETLNRLRMNHVDARRNRAMVRLGNRALAPARCRDIGRWLAFGWLLLTAAIGLIERKQGR